MSRPLRKFIAVLIAFWLPLFSGNALAVSVAMHAMGGDAQAVVVQEGEPCVHHANTPSVVDAVQSASAQEQDSSCGSADICHQACCGYLAAVSVTLTEVLPFALTYEPYLTQFQSIALTLLDPPPLVRV